MKKIVLKLYEWLPTSTIRAIGKNKSFKFLRDYFLRNEGEYKTVKVIVSKEYNNYPVKFDFYAPFKTAAKAKNKGFENTLLRNSINLMSFNNSQQSPIIFDVGSSYGYLSLVWAKTVLKNEGLLYAFEPGPYVSKAIEKNIHENQVGSTIKFFNYAVGNDNKTVEIYDAGNHSNMIKSERNIVPFSVKMVSIDQFILSEKIEKVDMIKVDVDGIELDILKGAEETLKKHKPILIVETNDENQILEFCLSLGYKILDQKLSAYESGQPVPPNIFCVEAKTYNNMIDSNFFEKINQN